MDTVDRASAWASSCRSTWPWTASCGGGHHPMCRCMSPAPATRRWPCHWRAPAYAYACTSGSFVNGLAGQRALVEAMRAAGNAPACTTSGALLDALAALSVDKVAIATPYDEEVTALLAAFLVDDGYTVGGYASLGLAREIWTLTSTSVAELARAADTPLAEAVFVSCTNVPTYDVIVGLEAELGKPVLTANQVTMWAAMRLLGRKAVGPGQRLLGA